MGTIYQILVVIDENEPESLPRVLRDIERAVGDHLISITYERGDDLKWLKNTFIQRGERDGEV